MINKSVNWDTFTLRGILTVVVSLKTPVPFSHYTVNNDGRG